MGYSFPLIARELLQALSHRQDNTYHGLCYTSCGALVGMEKSPMIDLLRSLNPVTETPQASALTTELNPILVGKEENNLWIY